MKIFKNVVIAKEDKINLVMNEITKVISFITLNHCELLSLWSEDFTGVAYRHTRNYAVAKNGVILFNFEVRVWENHAYFMCGKSRRTPLHAGAFKGCRWVPATLEALKNKAIPSGRIIQGKLYELTDL